MNDPVHGEKSLEVRAEWARWTRYEIIDGMVVPAEGAELKTYDPWNRFRANVGKYRTVEQPYLPFMELSRGLEKLREIGIRRSRRRGLHGPQNEADELILSWCNDHGLLGLLPVVADSIRLPPIAESETEDEYVLTIPWHQRTGGRWSSWRGTQRHQKPAPAPLTEKMTLLDWKDPRRREGKITSISDFDFFFFDTNAPERLAVRDQGQIACPNTPEFWTRYCESLFDIEDWSWDFTNATHGLSTWRTRAEQTRDLPPVSGGYRDRAAKYFKILDGLSLSAANSFRFRWDTDRIDEARVSAGLLSSYALMFLWDRMDGRRVLSCKNCGRYFVSDLDIDHARYCSPRCRNTAQKRRSRATSAKEVVQ